MTAKTKKAQKLDFKKEYKSLFSPSAKEPEIIEVPAFKYIMIDGQGDPNTSEKFSDKIQVLYGLSYTIKFMLKLDEKDPFDFTVPPLSGLWCADDMTAYSEGRKHEWKWTLMILMPDRVTLEVFEEGKRKLRKKKNPNFLDQTRLEIYEEGLSAQIMHIGPYAEEAPTIAKLHDFFQDKGYTFSGRHHEIYLSDPRRCQPEKMRTILRQSIKKK
jgi:hypothetical protein